MPELEEQSALKAIKDLGIIGNALGIKIALEQTAKIARAERRLLILGENGTGKELLAQYARRLSPRSSGPYRALNCGALTEQLFESTLFGYVRGAFTGADGDRPGILEVADKGTVFLDEVGELTPSMQTRLLRFLDEGRFNRIGSTEEKKVDVWVISATNRDLTEAVKRGTYRKDLLHRLREHAVTLPPLRERGDDLPLLARRFLEQYCQDKGITRRLSESAIEAIMGYHWEGNIRDLKNRIVSAAVLSDEEDIRIEDLCLEPDSSKSPSLMHIPEFHKGFNIKTFTKKLRAAIFQKALSVAEGNQSEAAKLLGVSSAAVSDFIKQKGQGHSKKE